MKECLSFKIDQLFVTNTSNQNGEESYLVYPEKLLIAHGLQCSKNTSLRIFSTTK